LGNSLAALANRLEMSPAGVGYAAQKGDAIAQQNGYQLIQWDIYLFKDAPQYTYIKTSRTGSALMS
jgi:hypothetical protein